MTKPNARDVARLKAWTHVKEALHVYAKRPSRSTELKVEEAVAEVRHSAEYPMPSSQPKKVGIRD